MWVARNRQKAPEDNAFAQRARRKRGETKPPAAPSAPEPAPTPVEVADAMPDLQALREATLKAAAVPFDRNPESEEYTQAPDISAYAEEEATAERKRGRPRPQAVIERDARVLQLVKDAEQVGISKPEIAALMDEKEQQVYTSLRQLQKEGHVENRYVTDIKAYRWFAV